MTTDNLSGTVDLLPTSENRLMIPVKISFVDGEVSGLWIQSLTSQTWHPLAVESGDCIGLSCFYIPEAYDKLKREAGNG